MGEKEKEGVRVSARQNLPNGFILVNFLNLPIQKTKKDFFLIS